MKIKGLATNLVEREYIRIRVTGLCRLLGLDFFDLKNDKRPKLRPGDRVSFTVRSFMVESITHEKPIIIGK